MYRAPFVAVLVAATTFTGVGRFSGLRFTGSGWPLGSAHIHRRPVCARGSPSAATATLRPALGLDGAEMPTIAAVASHLLRSEARAAPALCQGMRRLWPRRKPRPSHGHGPAGPHAGDSHPRGGKHRANLNSGGCRGGGKCGSIEELPSLRRACPHEWSHQRSRQHSALCGHAVAAARALPRPAQELPHLPQHQARRALRGHPRRYACPAPAVKTGSLLRVWSARTDRNAGWGASAAVALRSTASGPLPALLQALTRSAPAQSSRRIRPSQTLRRLTSRSSVQCGGEPRYAAPSRTRSTAATDANALCHSYDTMRKYTSLDPNSPSWTIDLEKNPLPRPKKDEEGAA